MIDKIYKFTERNTGKMWGYSCHEFPDFCDGLTRKQRDKIFLVEEITDKEEIKKHI